MPDITMCKAIQCPVKESCYRYKATPSDWQSYFVTEPYDKKYKLCNYYYETITTTKNTKDNEV